MPRANERVVRYATLLNFGIDRLALENAQDHHSAHLGHFNDKR